MTAQATEQFEDAPIRIVEYVDLLCPDCLYLNRQLDQLKEEFAGKINIAIQAVHDGLFADLDSVRAFIRRALPAREFEPTAQTIRDGAF